MGTNIYNYVTSFSYSYTDLLNFLRNVDNQISPPGSNPGSDQRNIIIFVDNKNNNDSNNSSYNYIVEISGDNLLRKGYNSLYGPLENYFWPVDDRDEMIDDDLDYFRSSVVGSEKHNLPIDANKKTLKSEMDHHFNLWIRTDKTLNDFKNEGNSGITLSGLISEISNLNNKNGLKIKPQDNFSLRGNSIKATSYWQI